MRPVSNATPAMRLRVVLFTCAVLLGPCVTPALDRALDINQYAHTAWTVRDGFSLGNIYAIAQTPDGYLWLGGEFGLFRFDGIRRVPWQPPPGQQLPDRNINALLVSRDGTLWIGTFSGLATWSGGKFTWRSELARQFVASLYEDNEGTVWAGTLEAPTARLCAIQGNSAQCYQESFGRAIWALREDGAGNLWAAAQSGLWRMRPGPPKQYPSSTELIGLNKNETGGLLIALHGGGLLELASEKLRSYPVRSATNPRTALRDRDIDSNRVLRDRDGGLWIGTVERGLIHVHEGRTDVFTKAQGLSGDVILSMFEDREGNVWVSSTGGLDRFRELPVSTFSVRQGLSSDATQSVLAATDGSIWIGAHDGLTRLKNGQATIFREGSGMPDNSTADYNYNETESLFQDDSGRLWASTRKALTYFKDEQFVGVNTVPAGEVHFITGDSAGNLWLSEHFSLMHLRDGHLVEKIPWSDLKVPQSAEVVLADREGDGVWIGFWVGGGLWYFKDHQLRTRFTTADGLGDGAIVDLEFDSEGALWASTQLGGLSRIKDNRVTTLTTRNGLPCDAVHWSIRDNNGSLWLYTACGLVRVQRTELDAWISDPQRRIEATVWDAADGVRIRSSAASAYGPRVAKATDGKLWFVTGEGVQVVDPGHITVNKLPPPVHIERVDADHQTYWQNSAGTSASSLRLPPRIHDLTIDYTAVTLSAPEKVHFKYLLEGQDTDWREVVNDREVQYSNLHPGPYRFRVIASNNSGVWNEQGDTLEFSVAPAYYQTNGFRLLCVLAILALLWAAYQLRLQQLHHEFEMTLDARVSERTRIARELHDTLLQSFQGILLQLQTLSNRLQDGENRKALDASIEQTAQAIVEGRDAVQGLRASAIESNDLAMSIRTLGEELSSADHLSRRPDFSVRLEGSPRNLHPILRDEVYRVTAEAMRNAFLHSKARRIEVELRYDEGHLQVRIRDDGKGIDPELLRSEGREGHFGLHGMRERTKLIGGNLTIWSELNSGCEIELSIPAALAYKEATNGSTFLSSILAKLSGRDKVKRT